MRGYALLLLLYAYRIAMLLLTPINILTPHYPSNRLYKADRRCLYAVLPSNSIALLLTPIGRGRLTLMTISCGRVCGISTIGDQ